MMWHDLSFRLRALFGRRRIKNDLDEELGFHLDRAAAKLVASGVPAPAARRRARREFGLVDGVKDDCRRAWGVRWLDELGRDTVYGFRMLRKRPGFSAAVVVSLALGIGANTAIFSLMDAVMRRLLPVEQPEALWAVGDGYRYQEYQALVATDDVLAGVAAYHTAPLNVSVDGSLEPTVTGQLVTGGYFGLLGVDPVLGRAIGPEDDLVPNGHPVAMLSDGYWTRRFGRDPTIVGQGLSISGTPFTVIGVTPPEFFGVEVGTAPDVFVPVMMQPIVMPTNENLLENPIIFRNWLRVLARLRPGVSAAQAGAALEAPVLGPFLSRFGGVIPDPEALPAAQRRAARAALQMTESMRPELTPAATGLSDLREQFSRPLFILMGAVGVLLVIACANTANLLLARATSRRREFAMRLALGAGRWRLVRQLMVESVLLAGMGGVAGVLLAQWATDLLVVFMSLGRTPIVLDLSPDLRVLGFTAAVAMLTGVLFGLAPAARATRIDVAPALKGSAGVFGGGRGLGPDRLLAVTQMGLSLVLLIGAGLFGRSLAALNERDAGFARDTVLVARVEPQGSDQRNIAGTSARLDRIYRDLVGRVAAIPGVQSASMAQFTPTHRMGLTARALSVSGDPVRLHVPMVYPGYFETMGLRLLAGRDFDEGDLDLNVRAEGADFRQRVGIVNETFALQVYPGMAAVGQACGGAEEIDQTAPCQIVGVVEDSAYADFTGEVLATRYQSFLQTRTGRGQMALHVRIGGAPSAMIPAVRAAVSQVDPTLPCSKCRHSVRKSMRSWFVNV